MKGKAIIPLAVGLGVGLLAIKLAVDAIQKAQGSGTTVPEVNVVVATTDIGPTMALTSDMLVVKKTPKSPLIPANAYDKIDEIVGRVTSKTIVAGMPLSPALLAPEGTLPGLGVKIEEGYRAVSVKIDEVTGVAYQLLPGAFVDVLVVMDVKDGKRKETISRVILQKVQVAAVGQHLGDPEGEKSGSSKAKSVTLLVKADDVPKLHLAQTKGKITLAMRSSEDEMLASSENALESEILGTPRESEPEPEAVALPFPGKSGPPSTGVTSLMSDTPPARPTFTTTVINGPVASSAAGQVLRVTYRDNASMDVVAVQEGRTSGDDGSLRFGSGGAKDETIPRRMFSDRDRTLRRLGAQGETPAAEEQLQESDTEEVE